MNNKKTVIRFFTIADYEDEEIWLHNQQYEWLETGKNDSPLFLYF